MGEQPNKASCPLTTEVRGRAGIITFSRPDLKNPLSSGTLDALEEALSSPEMKGADRIIITGSGGTFASGANIREVAELTPETAGAFGRRGQMLMLSISRMETPVIAAIDGFCMGGALDLAVACRARIASPRSVFAHPGPRLGIITGWGGTQFLPRLIGEKRALDILLTARSVSADEALSMGLIDAVSDDPLETALRFETK